MANGDASGSDGSWLLEPQSIRPFWRHSRHFVASIDGKRGFMKSDGTWLIEPKFDAVRPQDPTPLSSSIDGATGIMRLDGSILGHSTAPGRHVRYQQRDHVANRRKASDPVARWRGLDRADAERSGQSSTSGLLTFLKSGNGGWSTPTGHVMVEPQDDELVISRGESSAIAWARQEGKWCADRPAQPFGPEIACADVNPRHPWRPRSNARSSRKFDVRKTTIEASPAAHTPIAFRATTSR